MTAPPQPTKDDTTLSTPNQNRDPKDNVVSTPVQTPQKGDNVIGGTSPDQGGNSDIGKDQGFTPSQQNPGDYIINSDKPIWTNPDGTLIGTAGSSDGIREIDGNTDPNQAAKDFYDRVKGSIDTPIDQSKSRVLGPIHGVSGSETTIYTDGTAVTYRPAGAAGSKTGGNTASVDVNTSAAQQMNNGSKLKFKFKK